MLFSILGVNLQYVSVSGLCQACYVHFGLGCVSQPGSSLSEPVCPAVSHSFRPDNTPEDVSNLNMKKTVPILKERETQ